MKRLSLIGLGVLVALGGCGFAADGDGDKAAAAARIGPSSGAPSATPPASGAPSATPPASGAPSAPGPSAVSGMGSVKDTGDIPDPCTLFSKAEVVSLTGRAITQVDEDGAAAGDPTRYCQWQQDGGQLALFLSRTTKDDFDTAIDGATPVGGVGEDAFQLSGHLYVLYGTVQIDVYSRGASDEQNLTDAEEVAEAVIPRI
jgi:hypothetical protein